jgi:hypothetical protein
MKKLLLSLSFVALSSVSFAQLWTSQATGFSTPSRGLEEITIVNANTVWALAYDGANTTNVIQEFTRTTDGGTTWTAGTIDVGNPALGINNISAISATTAWVSAVNGTDGTGSVVYKTSDGGATWEQQNPSGFTGAASFVNFVHFFDANVGFAMGDPNGGEFEIWRSTDGGDSWTLVPGANIPAFLSGEYGYNGGNIVVGNTVWLPTNRGRILKSTDQGLTWTVTQAPLTDFGGTAQSGRLAFSDANNGCLLKTVGTNYTFYTTTNGGTTWSAGATFTGTRRLLTYIPGTTTIVATSAAAPVGTSLSTNNGSTWTDLEPGGTEQRGVSAFFNGATGWCAGFSSSPFTDGVFKLTNPLSNAGFGVSSTAFAAYPNPASSMVTITSEGIDAYQLNVTDLTGKVVLAKSLTGIENSVDVSSLSNGAYFFTISSDSRKETIKIIKN